MLTWLKGYRRELLAGDLGAGVLVVLMLVPQGMAYALVAGLPGLSCAQLCGPALCPRIRLALGSKGSAVTHTRNLNLHLPPAGCIFFRGRHKLGIALGIFWGMRCTE